MAKITWQELLRLNPKYPKLKAPLRRNIGDALANFTRNTYFSDIPIKMIFRLMAHFGVVVLDKDEHTPWAGMFLGNEGRALFEIAPHTETDDAMDAYTKNKGEFYIPYDNVYLVMTWYRMPSGKYEIVLYLS